jgi:hypothetical protein
VILSAHQPAYLPWIGYFDKILNSDIFIFLDTVQFEKNSFINRNIIKTPQGPSWLTIPVKVKGHINSSLLEIKIDEQKPWRKKHIKSIEMNYRKASRFEKSFSKIEEVINFPEANLSEYCFQHLKFWINELGIKTKIIRLSELPIKSKKSNLVLDLCRYFNVDNYLSGSLGKNYLVEEDFIKSKVNIYYQDYKQKNYHQLWGEFIPNLSILDCWMNLQDNKTIF